MRRAICVSTLTALGLWSHALAQSATVSVNCAGASIPSFGNTPDVVRTSDVNAAPGAVINAAPGYFWAFNPNVMGTGLFASVVGTRSLAAVLNDPTLAGPGSQRVLFGAMRNPLGTLPRRLDYGAITTIASGQTISLTLDHEIITGGYCRAAIRNIAVPGGFVIGLNVTSGGLIVSTFTPPPPTTTEWHFDGDLLSVKESNLTGAAASGPSKLRYLDDPAFGPLLGGQGALITYTTVSSGVTQAQSAFGTTTAFGIPSIGADPDTVYRTSAPRNTGAPTDSNKTRGIGLSLWPNTHDYWPDERIGQFTLIWDLLIPQASWNAALANATSNHQCIPLVEQSQNNNSGADQYLRVTGATAAGVGCAVHEVTPTNPAPMPPLPPPPPPSILAAPAIQPNQWFRLAIVMDLNGRNRSRLYVNGAPLGDSGADWIYNACKSATPTWGNNSDPNPIPNNSTNATAIPTGAGSLWEHWGNFPSPWAYSGSPTGTGTASGAPTASTFSLFADLFGYGESVYVANMAFSDQAMTDAQIAALGGPSARGIVYLRPAPCPADFNNDGMKNVADIFAYLSAWFAQSGQSGTNLSADFNHDNTVSVADIFAFLGAWFANCP